MPNTVFYSWQSDVPQNRSFVRSAIDKALQELAQEAEVEDAVRNLVADQDTQGIAGSPSIVDAILAKIDSATAVVSDLTFVAERPAGGKVPNPNVMLEYGYALRAHGDTRLIAVFNESVGSPQDLPFDLAHRRWPIRFHLEAGDTSEKRKKEKAILVGALKAAITGVMGLPKGAEPAEEPLALAKRYCRDDNLAIEWAELLSTQVQKLRLFVDEEMPTSAPDHAQFNDTLQSIAKHSEALRRIMLVCGRWGTQEALGEAVAAIANLSYGSAPKSGYNLWIAMRELPAVLCFYWLVCGSIAKNDLARTRTVLLAQLSAGRSRQPFVSELILMQHDVDWKLLAGAEQRHYPQSTFAESLISLDAHTITLTPEQAHALFADAEHLIALEFAYQRLIRVKSGQIWFWAPGGDFLWDTSSRRFTHLRDDGYKVLTDAGLLGGSAETAKDATSALRDFLQKHSMFMKLEI